MTKKNRISHPYYVGADHIAACIALGESDEWQRRTEAEAIAHGKELMEEQPDRDCVIIVKIVAVLRRQAVPIVVEHIK